MSLPDRDAILSFIRQSPSSVGKRQIARAFHLKGGEREALKALLNEMEERAAGQGDPWGLNNLGGMYEMGWGTVADHGKALDLYKQALAKGNGAAQKNIDRLTAAKAQ